MKYKSILIIILLNIMIISGCGNRENYSKKSNVIIKSPLSNKPVLRYVPNINKAFNELNLKIYTDIENSIRTENCFNHFQWHKIKKPF